MPLPPNRFKIWIAPAGTPQNIPVFNSSSPDPNDWVDISKSWQHEKSDIGITFAIQDESSLADPSTATIILDNRDGRFSPRNPTSPFFPDLSRNTPILITFFDGTFHRRLLSGFVSSWPLRWDRSAEDAWIPIEINGVLHRLEALNKPLRSALYRELVSRFNAGAGIVAYWPCEDGPDSNTIASPIPGVEPMEWDGELDLFASNEFVASDSLPVIGDGPGGGTTVPRVRGAVPSHTTTGEVSAHSLIFIDPDIPGTNRLMLEILTTGSAPTWEMRWDSGPAGGGIRVTIRDGDGGIIDNTVFAVPQTDGITGEAFKLSLDATQNGSDIDYTILLFFPEIFPPIGVTINDTLVNHTIGRVREVGVGAQADMANSAFGHVVVGNDTSIFSDTANVLIGWQAELAVNRMIRITDEENIPFTFERNPPFEPRMGPQGLKTVLELLRECEAADGGILGENTLFGLRYRDRTSLVNQTPRLELDAGLNDLAIEPEPTDDDQQLINQFEAVRENGSSFLARDEASITQFDLYDDSREFNVWMDNQLPSLAQWILHLGTVDEMRFPALDMQLANTPIHIDNLLTMRNDLGSRVMVKHEIPQLIGNEIDVQVIGWSETISENLWSITFNTRPNKPWIVGVFEHDFSESEIINSNPNVELSIDGWEALNGTIAHSDAFAQSGSFSIELTPDNTGEAQIVQTIATASDVTPGKTYRLSAWIRLTNVPLDCGLLFTTFDADFDPTVNDFGPLTTNVPIDTWTLLSYTTTAPEGVVQGIIKVRFLGALTNADVVYGDLITLTESVVTGNRFGPIDSELTAGFDEVDNLFDVDTNSGPLWTIDPSDLPFDIKVAGEVMRVTSITGATSPQEFTVDRSINGVIKSHVAGTSVQLANPAIFARGAQI